MPLNLYHRYSDERLESESNTAALFARMAFGFASWHADDGVNFSFADGSTRYLNAEIDPELLENLGNRQDRQAIEPL